MKQERNKKSKKNGGSKASFNEFLLSSEKVDDLEVQRHECLIRDKEL